MLSPLLVFLVVLQEPPKIKKVVLYKHGVGYFERAGKVRANQDVALSFKANQMQDLLTSLFAVDNSGGQVAGITYDSKDPIEKQLENILIDIPETNALTQFVAQLKGAKVEIKVGSETLRGSIMGIEPVQQKVDSSVVTTWRLVILRDDGQMQQTALLDVALMKLLDDPLQQDLKRVLDIHMKAKYADRKEVKIAFRGAGERDVVIGYLIETPIWKTTYRLIFAPEKQILQGWAIVDNPTEEDWENIDLTMVAGNPLSFVLDLYTPHYPARPVIGMGEVQGVAATFTLEESEKLRGERDKTGADRKNFRAAPKPEAEAAADPAKKAAPMLSDMLARGVEAAAQGAAVGELFAYTSKAPVSVPRGKAALIPIIAQNIDGDRVLYHKPGGRVMNSFYLKNSSPLTLEGGPVTVFEGSTSLGEGLLRRELKAGMKEMVSYAIEAGVRLERVTNRHPRPLHRATLANGILTRVYFEIIESEYKVHNETGKKHVLYLDHPKTHGFTLLDPKPEEELPDLYRMKLDLGPAITPLKLQERTELSTTAQVMDYNVDQIRLWINQPALSAKAKAFLDEVIAHKIEQARLLRDYDGMQSRLNQLTGDEQRYRSNIQVLRDSPQERELRERYVGQLAKIDDEMGKLRASMSQNEQLRRDLDQAFAKKVTEFKE